MNYRDAFVRLQQFLAPVTAEEFFDRMLVGGPRKIDGDPAAPRTTLLGSDPRALLTAAVHQFHARNDSLLFPQLRTLSASLDALARALEMLLHTPVSASASWSRGGTRGPVRYEDHDLLAVQLLGCSRWHVSSSPSELDNTWRAVPEGPLELGPHRPVEVGPGDLMYFPRGTLYSVDSDQESLQLSIGFTPLTVRDAVIAALDHLSDLDRGWRMSFGGPLALLLRGPGLERFNAPVLEAATNLAAACKAPGFLAGALQARSSRAVAALEPLPAPQAPPLIGLDTELVQSTIAFCQLTGKPESIEVSYPGGRIPVPRAAQQSLEHIVNTPRFRVRDIPGEVGDDIRLSLVRRFVEIGYLGLAEPGSPTEATP